MNLAVSHCLADFAEDKWLLTSQLLDKLDKAPLEFVLNEIVKLGVENETARAFLDEIQVYMILFVP